MKNLNKILIISIVTVLIISLAFTAASFNHHVSTDHPLVGDWEGDWKDCPLPPFCPQKQLTTNHVVVHHVFYQNNSTASSSNFTCHWLPFCELYIESTTNHNNTYTIIYFDNFDGAKVTDLTCIGSCPEGSTGTLFDITITDTFGNTVSYGIDTSATAESLVITIGPTGFPLVSGVNTYGNCLIDPTQCYPW